ncbi:hypothetical protein [Chryseobacterium sp. JUb7]|uniref:hypothetical protein n=1 Tax=Chryseobacterium sp. JUb7 TaxID=2940599 RepID=UPI0021673AEC|nr:hypothetical protein [Chryseobacterium sp. JUb7]MCS3532721.1 hypothetical protein [Chryseobacterium sp. JUb7]
MAKIIINRSSEFANYIRSIDIYLGNKKIGEIKNGESKEFDVKPGKHSLVAKIDWCSSNFIDLDIHSDQEIVRFNLNGRNPFFSLYYVTFGKNQYLKLESIK